MRPRTAIAIPLAVTFIGLAGTGCQSASQYVSPQIEGRVLDSVSHAPIDGVEVRRLSVDDTSRGRQSTKGGELIGKGAAVYTASDGTFTLDSERDLALFRKTGWFSVTLSFRHRSYEYLTATYTPGQATNNVTNEPLIKTGDIFLHPRAK